MSTTNNQTRLILSSSCSSSIKKSSPYSLISLIYNNIKQSQYPRCCNCNNEQIQRRQKVKQNYYQIPNRYIQMYICTFCKKYNQPKCIICFQNKWCCPYKNKILYQESYKLMKQDVIKITNSVYQTIRFYQHKAEEDLTLPFTKYVSPQAIYKDLMICLQSIQNKFKKDTKSVLYSHYQELFNACKQFQTDVTNKLSIKTSQSTQNIQKNKNNNLINSSSKKMTLFQCAKFLKQLQTHKQMIDGLAHQVIDVYFEKMNINYPKQLYAKIMQGFRNILHPEISYKEGMCQTTQSSGSSHSIHSDKSIKVKKQQNAGAIIDEKVLGLQRVIQRNLDTISRLEQKIKDLESVIEIQQSKNQQLQMKILQLEIRLGVSYKKKELVWEQNESKKQKINNSKIINTKLWENKQRLKTSKSDPNLLNYNQTQEKEQIKRQKQKNDKKIQESKYEINKQQMKTNNQNKLNVIKKVRKQSDSKKGNKDKSLLQNSSWLEEVVSQIKQ